MLSEAKALLASFLPFFIAILILCIFCYIISLIALIPAIKEQAKQESSFRKTTTLVLGTIAWLCVFVLATFLVTNTSQVSPPHGVSFAVAEWTDENGSMNGVPVIIDETTKEEFNIEGSMIAEIGTERMWRYLLPPFLRYHCYADNVFACKWADIDIKSFNDGAEWFEYLIRLGIGLLSSLVTGLLAWSHTKTPKANSIPSPA